MKSTSKLAIILITIIILGSALRISAIDKEDYWIDEGVSIIDSKEDNLRGVTDSVFRLETSPPLYFYILHYWIKIFGDTPNSTRYLSVIFGILSIPLVFFISRKISSERVSLLTTFLFSISMLNIWISQEVRPYSLFIFLTLLSTLVFVNLVKSKRLSWHVFYLISILLLVFSSYFSVFVIFFHFMFLLFRKDYSTLKKVFLIQLISVLALLPWLIIDFSADNEGKGLVYEILRYHAQLPNFIAQFGQFALISPLIFLSFFVILFYLISLKHPLKIKHQTFNTISVLIMLILVFYLILILNIQNPLVRRFFTWTRYFLFLSPVGSFIIAKTFFNSKKIFKIFLFLTITLLAVFSLTTYYTTTLKEEWTPAMKHIKETRSSSNGIIFVDEGGANMFLIEYYGAEMDSVELAWKSKMLKLDEVKSHTEGKQFAWLILSRNWKNGYYYKILFDNNFDLLSQAEFNGIKLFLYSTS